MVWQSRAGHVEREQRYKFISWQSIKQLIHSSLGNVIDHTFLKDLSFLHISGEKRPRGPNIFLAMLFGSLECIAKCYDED
jgi:hypothetical protein